MTAGHRGCAMCAAVATLAGAAALVVAGHVRARGLHFLLNKRGFGAVYTVRDASGEPVRVLRRGGVYQSATYLGARRFEPVFAYYRAFDALFDLRLRTSRALMIGGGGFSWPKHALTSHRALSLDVAEIDPAVVDIARRHFFVDELEFLLADPKTARGNALSILVEDGRFALERAAVGDVPHYDAIINDSFSGADPVYELANVSAAQLAHGALVPGGVYLMNVVSRSEGMELRFLRDEVATLLQVFDHVEVALASDDAFGGEDNYLVAASDGPLGIAGAIPFDESFLGCPIR